MPAYFINSKVMIFACYLFKPKPVEKIWQGDSLYNEEEYKGPCWLVGGWI